MAHEIDSRDGSGNERAAVDSPIPVENAARPAAPGAGESQGEKEIHEELKRRIVGARFPASRNELLRHVGPDERGAVESRLRMLPPDQIFSSPEEVMQSFGGLAASG
jgi:hypothetical protein